MNTKKVLETEIVFAKLSSHGKFKDLTGQVFGRLTVIGFAGKDKYGQSFWYCRCECKNITKILSGNLRSNATKSCGCLHIDSRTTHGHTKLGTKTPEYRTWKDMLQRTQNPNNKRYKDYGGRGIKVCERWSKFENFLADMGERPKGKTLDRIENDKGYHQANCKWATPTEQANNTRRNRVITYNGLIKSISQWSTELGLNQSTISYRLNNGWSIDKALTTPSKRSK